MSVRVQKAAGMTTEDAYPDLHQGWGGGSRGSDGQKGGNPGGEGAGAKAVLYVILSCHLNIRTQLLRGGGRRRGGRGGGGKWQGLQSDF